MEDKAELGARIAAALTGKTLEFREFFHAFNPYGVLARITRFEETYLRILAVLEDKNFIPAVMDIYEDYFREKLEQHTGLVVKEISEEGIARAIGDRAGVVLRSLHDVDIIAEDMWAELQQRIEARMGWVFEKAIKKADDLLAELERRARAELEKRIPGLVLHDLTDRDKTEEDFAKWAARWVSEKTGVALTDIRDVEKSKKQLLNWADAECRRRLKIEGTRMGGGLVMTKKGIKNRAAQRRFYAQWGNRRIYNPV